MGSYNLILTALSSAQDLIPAPGSVEAARQRALGTGGAARRHQRPGLLWRCHARLGLRCHAGDLGWSGLSWDWVGIGLRSTFSLLLILGGWWSQFWCAFLVEVVVFLTIFPLLIRFPFFVGDVRLFWMVAFGDSLSTSWMTDAETHVVARNHLHSHRVWTCANQETVRIQMIVFRRSWHIWFIYLLKGYLVGTHRVAWSCRYCFIIFFPFYPPA